MKINRKKRLKEEVLQYLREEEIDATDVDSIELSGEEITRGLKEGSLSFIYGCLPNLLGYSVRRLKREYRIKINDTVIGVRRKDG